MTEEESFERAIALVERFVAAHERIAEGLVTISQSIDAYGELMRAGDQRIIEAMETYDDEQEPRQ